MPNNTAINFFFFFTSIIRLAFTKNIIKSQWTVPINFRKAMTTFVIIDVMMIKYSFSVQPISLRMVTSACMSNFLIRSIYFISLVYFHYSMVAGFAAYSNSSTRESHFFNQNFLLKNRIFVAFRRRKCPFRQSKTSFRTLPQPH